MKTVYSPLHQLHWLRTEMSGGELKPCFEKPARAEFVLNRIKQRQLGEIIEPLSYPIEHLTRIHNSDYIEFLRTCWSQWEATLNSDSDAVATVFRSGLVGARKPKHIEGIIGYYSGDLTAGLGKRSWEAIKASADVALQAADCIIQGDRSAFALCRPSGHHASAALMAGYCYVNNAAVAAQYLIDRSCKRVAVLDIDYHHGNGTQSIFYDRSDVLVASIHGDPDYEYPFYLGFADEKGSGDGEGYNLNYPMPLGTTGWTEYRIALEHCLGRIQEFEPDILVVSLGVDTYEHDPISHFKLKSEHFGDIGTLLESVGLPTLFVFEGGYAVEELGINTVNVLEAFDGAVGTAGLL